MTHPSQSLRDMPCRHAWKRSCSRPRPRGFCSRQESLRGRRLSSNDSVCVLLGGSHQWCLCRGYLFFCKYDWIIGLKTCTRHVSCNLCFTVEELKAQCRENGSPKEQHFQSAQGCIAPHDSGPRDMAASVRQIHGLRRSKLLESRDCRVLGGSGGNSWRIRP